MPEGVDPIPDHVLLEPKWLLEPLHKSGSWSQTSKTLTTVTNTIAGAVVSAESPLTPPSDLLDVPGGLTAKVLVNERVTPATHWQDVRHLVMSTPSLHPYTPGDVLTIYPKNFPVDVNEFLKIMQWESVADDPLKFISTSSSSTTPLPNLPTDSDITLRKLLTNHLDIMSIPRRSFFAQLAHFTDDDFQRDRLLEFTNPEYIDELYDYTTRPRRSILEVLQEFETVKIPWQRICSIIPAMRGRQFSIASALSPSSLQDHETRIELLIAIVKYRTVIKRIRQGVCTRYIATLKPGQEIRVTLNKGGLGVTKDETKKPIVMVGPGTGVAPMRALIYQRKYCRQELQDQSNEPTETPGSRKKDILFFGCRNAEADFFFKSDWDNLVAEGVPLDVFPAFSRDQVCISSATVTTISYLAIILEAEGICSRPCP